MESWYREVRHKGLNKYRMIKGIDKHAVEQKAAAQKAVWDEMWGKKQEQEKRNKKITDKKQKAINLTRDAEEAIKNLDLILLRCLDVKNIINWETLKDSSQFSESKPIKRNVEKRPVKIMPEEINKEDLKYRPKPSILDIILPSIKMKKVKRSEELFKNDYDDWERNVNIIKKINEENDSIYMEELANSERDYIKQFTDWESRRINFLANQEEKNNALERRKLAYFEKTREGIVDYLEMVLANSVYPDSFPQEFKVDFLQTGIAVVDYWLPSLSNVSTLKEVKYIQSKNELREVHMAESVRVKLFDDLVYKIALRTIYELFSSDLSEAILSVVFNGWVCSVNKATGQEGNSCIISIQTNKKEFMSINLRLVDPKECFKKLKGIGSSKLHSMTAIAPILTLNKEDPRFIDPYDVANTLEDTYNLAAMDWQDFEQLIREIFEKEFNQNGGEVKITRASRDGGVDAVAFDPDPLRGGKIIIQAKRYTNVVGVSAVRDLYGTVVNEGAIKGILVSTADYGPDAYSFAKDKPLTLLNGSNLLHLLEKHGHKAKIDLKEAKLLLASL